MIITALNAGAEASGPITFSFGDRTAAFFRIAFVAGDDYGVVTTGQLNGLDANGVSIFKPVFGVTWVSQILWSNNIFWVDDATGVTVQVACNTTWDATNQAFIMRQLEDDNPLVEDGTDLDKSALSFLEGMLIAGK